MVKIRAAGDKLDGWEARTAKEIKENKLWDGVEFAIKELTAFDMAIDLPPEAPSFITRVCGFGFHIRWFQFQQAGRVRSPQIVQVLDVFQWVFGFQVMSAV
jgi:hypothetical protein